MRELNISKSIVTMFFYLLCFCSSKAQQHWEPVKGGLGSGSINESVTSLINDTVNNLLYAVGTFTKVDDTIGASGIAIWDNHKWFLNYKNIPGGNLTSAKLLLYNGQVYEGRGDGILIYYNGTTWKLAGTFDGAVTSLCVYHNKLYAGGKFSSVNGVTAYRIACYDGVKWDSVGGGVYWSQACCSSVDAMTVWRDKLIIGGTFDRAVNPDNSEINAGSIAAWNDTNWSAMGEMTQQTTGVNTGYVYSAGVYKNDLIIGGQFERANTLTVNGIARWDGNNWFALGGGVKGFPYCVLQKDTSLYVGGQIYLHLQPPDSYGIVRWDGYKWNVVDSGVGGDVYAMAIYDSVLYIGGNFNRAGKVSLKNIARLVPDTIPVSVTPLIARDPQLVIYPNPVTNQFEVSGLEFEINDEITVTDLLGRVVQRTVVAASTSNFKLQTSNYPTGIYFVQIKTKNGTASGKFVKE